MTKRDTPLLIIAYNRPHHLSQLLESVKACARLDECDVHIFCDGAKCEQDEKQVAATRSVVRAWANEHDARVVERNENIGLARSIVSAVTELCDVYGRVIVLEDDLVVSSDFIDYMLRALDRYENDERIFQISGFMFPIDVPIDADAFFIPLTTTWGWATWSSAWKHFDWDGKGALLGLSDKDESRSFDLDNSYPFTKMLEDRLLGRNDSWGILWRYAVFQRNGLVLYPRRSLVRVEGFGNCSTHSKGKPLYAIIKEIGLHSNRPIVYQAEIETAVMVLDRIKCLLSKNESLLNRVFTYFKYIIRSPYDKLRMVHK